ncbi:MAG: pyridoxamine 5'-phosphate oxidase family protein [Pseudomonadota bacterium]
MPIADELVDPLALFNADRSAAFAAKDPMAALCSVATIDAQGHPCVRTLVLRDLEGQLALFVNASSPKWNALQEQFSIMTYWPSQQIQYRFMVSGDPIPHEIVAQSWDLRPAAPKRMDWFYEQMATQSTPIADRDTLLAQLDALELNEPLNAPSNARGLALNPVSVERLDLTQENGVHDRVLFARVDEHWEQRVLVP